MPEDNRSIPELPFVNPIVTKPPPKPPPAGKPHDPETPSTLWYELRHLVTHVFLGAGLFLLLAIPAVALDFFNQGVHLLEFKAPLVEDGQHGAAINSPTSSPPVEGAALPDKVKESNGARMIRVSRPVGIVLQGFEYLLLGADVVGIGAYLLNTLWKFLKSLKW
jgi:hypothetical protein